MRLNNRMILGLITLLTVVLWGVLMMGWLEGAEIYLLPFIILLWLFILMKWMKRNRE